MESKSAVLLVAGLGFFVLAFLSNGVVPWLMYPEEPETVEQMIQKQVDRGGYTVVSQFKNLYEFYRESFEKHYGAPPDYVEENGKWTQASIDERERWFEEKCAEALRLGRQVYVGEACWHCHSQFVRPVSNEEKRWGPVSKSWEYQNELQQPVLFGTRRVGPDLSREGGRRSNGWHAVHFWRPRDTSPKSVMPRYTWFFDGDKGKLNRRGIAIITYVQFLGSWLDDYPYVDNPAESRDKPSIKTYDWELRE